MSRSKTILILLILISVGFNVFFLLKSIDASLGGGIHLQSPDEAFTVMLNSRRNVNPLVDKNGVYAEVTVHAGYIADKVVKRIIISPITTSNDMEYRNLKDPIKWAENSKEFTVTTPDFKLTVNMGVVTNHSMTVKGPVWQ
jgi:hypothetical protein